MTAMAWWLPAVSLASAAAYMVCWAVRHNAGNLRAMQVAWGLHAVALGVDVLGGGPGARFGFATAISATVWLVVGAHLLEQSTLPMTAPRRVLASLGVAAVALAAVFPGEHRTAESPWAPLHWLLGIVSYGLMGAAVVHAWLLDRTEQRLRGGHRTKGQAVKAPAATPFIPLLTLERLTFRFVDAGFVVLTLALALGAWFALQTSAGWRWGNHKTVLSLAGWATFALLVIGRHVWGWRGRRATRWVYVGAVLLLLAYVGSQFVYSVLLGRTALG